MSSVQEFVGNAHGDFDAVRTALEADATLANAAWDWGDGDWETGLGAAAHMGRRDIAELLLARAPIRWASSVVGVHPTRRKGSTRRRTRTSFADVIRGRRTTETLTRTACSLPGGTPGRSVSMAA